MLRTCGGWHIFAPGFSTFTSLARTGKRVSHDTAAVTCLIAASQPSHPETSTGSPWSAAPARPIPRRSPANAARFPAPPARCRYWPRSRHAPWTRTPVPPRARHLPRERNVGGNAHIGRGDALGDPIIGGVGALGHDDHAHVGQLAGAHGAGAVGDDEDGQVQALGDAVAFLAYGAGVAVYVKGGQGTKSRRK